MIAPKTMPRANAASTTCVDSAANVASGFTRPARAACGEGREFTPLQVGG